MTVGTDADPTQINFERATRQRRADKVRRSNGPRGSHCNSLMFSLRTIDSRRTVTTRPVSEGLKIRNTARMEAATRSHDAQKRGSADSKEASTRETLTHLTAASKWLSRALTTPLRLVRFDVALAYAFPP
ncbi:hypothetical protein PHSY_000750 [Pseudozyma hubeiensis SY62]|uniref:Uncharacterized protein n=1 Tax=Pseudozyma hubeiensis (strain SY62) TaxID=1305764 RepID=R9NXB8_PSEHS|nr:hypothetical protein PHSY_000750 [Pseudozyma hubeiensis SY62]GAC93187.1 hypothetical protein PHSY_000750 [Pseudozyma hubeiensis SY62]